MSRTEAKVHGVIFVIILLMISNFALDIYKGSVLSRQDPYVMRSSETINPQLKAGENLAVRYKFFRSRYCRTDLDRFIIREDSNDVVWRDRVPGGAGVLGELTVINKIKIPDDTVPGQYLFRTLIYATCSDHLYDSRLPDAKFEVIK